MMRKYIPILIGFLPMGLLVMGVWLLYRFVFKSDSTATDLKDKQGTEVKAISSDVMANGLTYMTMARKLLDTMFSEGFAGHLFFSVDEEALGRMLQSIQPSELARLEQLYPYAKQARNEELGTSVVLGRGGSLAEDLTRSLSEAEKAKYGSHLAF